MADPPDSEITKLLTGLSQDEAGAADKLLPLVYERLRSIAQKLFKDERADHTLQPTVLVHDAWLKLTSEEAVSWSSRTHFFAIGAKAMRRILADHARAQARLKRGGGRRAVALEDGLFDAPDAPTFLDLDAAIEKLEKLDPRQGEVVELRFFAGMKVAEIAEALGVSTRTVEQDWRAAKAWLSAELDRAR